jgi:hypothetical protein
MTKSPRRPHRAGASPSSSPVGNSPTGSKKTPGRIIATAKSLKEDPLDHLWVEPEKDRDWDVMLLTRFIDGLIETASSTKI